jgi:hypothetical protein
MLVVGAFDDHLQIQCSSFDFGLRFDFRCRHKPMVSFLWNLGRSRLQTHPAGF